MKKIKLTQGKFALVDDEDFERVSQYKWTAEKCSKSENYYARNRTINAKMHRLIMGVCKSKLVVDHVNHRTLDNRKENLRVCTQKQNLRNRKNKFDINQYCENNKKCPKSLSKTLTFSRVLILPGEEGQNAKG